MAKRHDIPYGVIWGLVWPQLVTMSCTLVLGLTDTWAGGRIGGDVQASFGMSNQLLNFFMVLAGALGAGAMAAVSQSMGAGRKQRASRYCSLILCAAVCLGIVIGTAGYLCRDVLFAALRVPEGIAGQASYYYAVALLMLPAEYVIGVGGNLFRASSNVMAPLFVTACVCAVNVFGDLGFGLGFFGMPSFGGKGIAWSTFAAVCLGAGLTVWLLKRGGLLVAGGLPAGRWMRGASAYLMKVTVPALGSQMLWQIGYLVLYAITASLGVASIAGLTAGLRVEAILYMPALAFNVTASILVGNALGAGDRPEAFRIGTILFVMGVAVMTAVGAAMWPFRVLLAETFSHEPEVVSIIASYLFFNIICAPFTVGGMIMGGILTGAGATKYIMLIQGASVWFVRLPLAWVLAHPLGYGAPGVFCAMLISCMVQLAAFLIVFIRGRWTGFAMRSAVTPKADKADRKGTEGA